MNAPRTQPITWHQIDERAHAFAGDNAVVRQIPEVFCRYPGLNIHLVDRLDSRLRAQAGLGYIDYTKDHQGKNSPIYGISLNNLLAKMPELFPDHAFENREQQKQSLAVGVKHILENIDKGQATHMGTILRQPAQAFQSFGEPPVNTEVKNMHSIVFGYSDMATRQEILATLANAHPADITTEVQGSLAELHAFVQNHEFQHGRSAQTWARDPDFFEPMGTAAIEREKPCYTPLKNKAMLVRNLDDPYIQYLNEQVSDAVAALHHLKNGGSMGLLQNIADARAIGAVNGGGRIHHTAGVLDAIIGHENMTRSALAKLKPEELDDLGVLIVGQTAWTRTEYYENAMAASFGLYVKARDMGKPHEEQEIEFELATHVANRLSEKYSSDILEQTDIRARAEKRFDALQARANEAKHRLVFKNLGQVAPFAERHLVEVNAAVKYNQAQHPDLNNPQGAQHLLRVRTRQLQAEGRYSEVERDVFETLDARADYQIQAEVGRQKAVMRLENEETTQLILGGFNHGRG